MAVQYLDFFMNHLLEEGFIFQLRGAHFSVGGGGLISRCVGTPWGWHVFICFDDGFSKKSIELGGGGGALLGETLPEGIKTMLK